MSGEETTFNTSNRRENNIKMNSKYNEHTSRINVWHGQVVRYRLRPLISEYAGAYFSGQKFLFFK